ncbi:MAG: ABC transporter ATP-binding protein [Alphaproteobacteria bacterium]
MRANLARLYELLAGHRRACLIALLVMLAAAIAESLGLALILPLLTVLLDPGESDAPGALATAVAALSPGLMLGLLVGAFVIKTALQVAARGLSYHLALKIRENWTTRLLRRFLEEDYARNAEQAQGVVLQNIVQETQLAARAITQMLDFANRTMISVALTLLLLATNPMATLIVAAVGGLVIVIVRKSSDRYAGRFGELRLSLAQAISDNVAESIATVKQIKIFDLASRRLSAVAADLARYTRAETLFIVFAELPYQLTELLVLTVMAGTLLVTFVYLELPPAEVIPMLGFIALVAQRLITYVTHLTSLRTKIVATLPSLRLVDGRLKEDPLAEALDAGQAFEGLREGIRFRDVSLRHANGAEVLRRLDLEIGRGQTVALIGPSGSGKSTVANLLLGLLRPSGGAILVDGQPLEGFSLRSLRRRIGYVAQEAELFHATIRENVMAGQPEASEAAFLDAVRAAHVADFAEGLPGGYDTVIGDRGVKMSGGQRQRVAIARALIRQPELMIFDEATSALDRESEALIQETIGKVAQSGTVLIISHRTAAVRDADRIYRLTDGKAEVVEKADLRD